MKKRLLKTIVKTVAVATLICGTLQTVPIRAAESNVENNKAESEVITGNEVFEGYIDTGESDENPIQGIVIVSIAGVAGVLFLISFIINSSKKKQVLKSKEYVKKQNERVKEKKKQENEDLNRLMNSYEKDYEDKDIDTDLNMVKSAPRFAKRNLQTENENKADKSTVENKSTENIVATPQPVIESTVTPQPVVQPQMIPPVAAPQQVYVQPIMQPAYQQPVYGQPVVQPTYQQPVMQPAYQQPIYVQPVMQPAYQQPVYGQTTPVVSNTNPTTENKPVKKIPAYARKNNTENSSS